MEGPSPIVAAAAQCASDKVVIVIRVSDGETKDRVRYWNYLFDMISENQSAYEMAVVRYVFKHYKVL